MKHPDPRVVRRSLTLVALGLALAVAAQAQSPGEGPPAFETPAQKAVRKAASKAEELLAERKLEESKKAREAGDDDAGDGDGDGEEAGAEEAADGEKAGAEKAGAKKAGANKAGAKKADGDSDDDDSEPIAFTPQPAPPLPELDANEGRGLRAVVLPIKGTIDMGLAPFVDRALQEAQGAAVIILDVDTFGGRVDAAVQIRDALLRTEIPVVAFVHNRAISAGALISLAADHIVFAAGGSMGAATPVQVSGGQAQAVGEKMVSYMRSEMRATAEANGRPGVIAEAMVDADVAIEGVIAKGKLLTITTDEALKLGVAADKLGSVEAILEKLNLPRAEVRRPVESWSERVARFLTDPMVSGLLMSLGMLGLLLEFYTPGFGVAGAVGVLCLLLFFGGSSIAGLAGWEEMLLFALGTIALAVEVFIIPGFGVAGVVGLGLIGTSLVMALLDMPIGTSWETGALGDAMAAVVISLLGTAVMAIVIIRFLPGSFLGRWLVLEHTLGGSATGAAPAPDEPWEAAPNDNRRYLGQTGVATTDLRPAGKVRLGDDVVDVVSRDRWIERGTPIKVAEVEGVRVAVIEDEDAY